MSCLVVYVRAELAGVKRLTSSAQLVDDDAWSPGFACAKNARDIAVKLSMVPAFADIIVNDCHGVK
jgi:hypothetical protein